MGGAYTPWTVRCEFAPDKSPLVPPAFGDWVGLGVPRSFSFRRGKQDTLNKHEPSQCTIVLDRNRSDLMTVRANPLDQSIAASPIGSGHALPDTPVRLVMQTGFTSVVIFSGFTLDGWDPSGSPKGSGTITVTLTDWLGWAASRDFPESRWAAWVSKSQPALWMRSELFDEAQRWTGVDRDMIINTAYAGTFYFSSASLVPDSANTAYGFLTTATRTGLKNPTVAVPQSDAFGLRVWIKTANTVTKDFRVEGGDWYLYMNATGQMVFGTTVGGVLNEATLAFNHADGIPHLIHADAITVGAGRTVTLSSDLGITTGVVSNSGQCGGGQVKFYGTEITVDEFCLWTTVVPAGGPSLATWVQGDDLYAYGQTRATRLIKLCESAYVPLPANSHTYADATLTLHQLVPQSTLASAVRVIVESFGGDCFVQRNGTVRMRDATYTSATADDYTTVHAFLTDAPNLPVAPPQGIRYSTRGRTGTRKDRVVNDVRVNMTEANSLVHRRDMPSQSRYNVRPFNWDSEATSSTALVSAANTIITRYKDPTIEIGDLTIRPWGNQAVTDTVIQSLELERKVSFRESTPDTSAAIIINSNYRIIGESWDWSDGTAWTVVLKIAPV